MKFIFKVPKIVRRVEKTVDYVDELFDTTAGRTLSEKSYGLIYKRLNRPDYSVTPGLRTLERVPMLPRKTYFVEEGSDKLACYLHRQDRPKGLVVVMSGMYSGADDYLSAVWFFYQAGFSVLSFDYIGTYGSTGKSNVGMLQALVDADTVLCSVERDPELSRLPLFLFGHSWGGYASCAALALHPQVSGVFSVAGFNDAYRIFNEKGEQIAGPISRRADSLGRFFTDYQKKLFGDYTEYTALRGINSSRAAVVLAHGILDLTVSYREQSIVAHRSEFTNSNVTILSTKGKTGGHNNIWHSEDAIQYSHSVKAKAREYKRIRDGGASLRDYVASVDHFRFSAVNDELFEKALQVFLSVL